MAFSKDNLKIDLTKRTCQQQKGRQRVTKEEEPFFLQRVGMCHKVSCQIDKGYYVKKKNNLDNWKKGKPSTKRNGRRVVISPKEE